MIAALMLAAPVAAVAALVVVIAVVAAVVVVAAEVLLAVVMARWTYSLHLRVNSTPRLQLEFLHLRENSAPRLQLEAQAPLLQLPLPVHSSSAWIYMEKGARAASLLSSCGTTTSRRISGTARG